MEQQAKILSENSQAIVEKVSALWRLPKRNRYNAKCQYIERLSRHLNDGNYNFDDIENAAKSFRDRTHHFEAILTFNIMLAAAKLVANTDMEAKAYSQLVKTYIGCKQYDNAVIRAQEFAQNFGNHPKSGSVARNQLRQALSLAGKRKEIREQHSATPARDPA